MPGSRRSLGSVVAPRPLVEKIRNPLYDSILISNNSQSDRLFIQPIGTANTNAINGIAKTEIDTNMTQAGSLPTPKSFDVEGISVKFEADATQAIVDTFMAGSYVQFRVGEKNYLTIPVYAIPGDVGIEGNTIRTGGAALGAPVLSLHNGIGMHKNIFDLLIPEEVQDSSGRGAWTGRKVPIHLPSNQQFSVEFIHPGGLSLGSGNTLRVYVYLWGELKREVH